MSADRSAGYFSRVYKRNRAEAKPGWCPSSEFYGERLARIKAFLRRLNLPRGSRVLEMGCGAGNLSLEIAKGGFEVYGVDISPEAIAWARERASRGYAGVDFRVGNVTNLASYCDGFFDLVLDGYCLQFIIGADRAVCLASVFRVLSSGGLFYAKAELINEALSERVDLSAGVYFDPKTQCVVSEGAPRVYVSHEKEFPREIEQAGFQLIACERSAEVLKGWPRYKAGTLWVEAIKPTDEEYSQDDP